MGKHKMPRDPIAPIWRARWLPQRAGVFAEAAARGHELPLLAVLVAALAAGFTSSCGQAEPTSSSAPQRPRTWRVPEEFATIQQAVDAAPDGATVLVAPGTYHEAVCIAGKSLTLASWYLTTDDRKYIRRTVLDGSIEPDPDPDDDIEPRRAHVILIAGDAGAETNIVGLTIRDGDDGISCHAKARISHNRFVNNNDGIDYEGGGGQCLRNFFVANDDDAVDLDLACEAVITKNEMTDNDDDGIEIRLHDYRGKQLHITICHNMITGNGEDGIQIIDYPGLSDRVLRIERNLIAHNAMAGIGCMADGNTRENFEGANIAERIEIVNNTIYDNQYGITGGDCACVFNNILLDQRRAAMKNVDGRSTITHNLFWGNGAETINCTLAGGSIIRANPRLDTAYKPGNGRICIDAGARQVQPPASTGPISPASYSGSAPDLGAYEIE